MITNSKTESMFRVVYWKSYEMMDHASLLRHEKRFTLFAKVHNAVAATFSLWYAKQGELFDARIINHRRKNVKKALQQGKWFEFNDEGTKTINEFEAHDLCATWYHFEQLKNHQYSTHPKDDGIDMTSQIIINWEGYETDEGEHIEPTMEDKLRLEREINKCIKHMHEVDGILHDIAEYTC